MQILSGAPIALVSVLVLSGCATPVREAAGPSEVSSVTATASATAAEAISTPSPTVATEAATEPSVTGTIGLHYIPRVCIVNNTSGSLLVHWENAAITWRNGSMTGRQANHPIERGGKTCGAGPRATEQPDAPPPPMPIDQMTTWATFTSSVRPGATYRVGADSRGASDRMQAGVAVTPGVGEHVYAFPVGEQRGWTLSETPLVLDRNPNFERTQWGPMTSFTLTVG